VKINIEAAPMAGYTDQAFRRTLVKCGCKVVWTEMVSVAALYYKKCKCERTLELLKFDRKPGVKNVVQIFGKIPEHFKYTIECGVLDGFDEININMGCPANKIIKNGEGAALMSKPELAREIVETCVAAAKVPISVKMRLDNVMEIAKICEDAGASRIIVHGRFAAQGYGGVADWGTIAEVVRAVNIPVIANGDVRSVEDARRCIEVTGAAGVMMGRALFGSPWAGVIPAPGKGYAQKIFRYHEKQHKKCGHKPQEFIKHRLMYEKKAKGTSRA